MSVHIYILNDKHINGNFGGHKTIDQLVSMLVDDCHSINQWERWEKVEVKLNCVLNSALVK